MSVSAIASGRACLRIWTNFVGTIAVQEQLYQSVRICACAKASCSQQVCQVIEEADTFGGATSSREVGIRAVGQGCVVRLRARVAEAIDVLEDRKSGRRVCLSHNHSSKRK